MKKTKTIEIECCDICKGESLIQTCNSCGTMLCWDHREEYGVVYSHAVYFSGSGDGFYCKECDSKLLKSGKDKKHNAYRAVGALRTELKTWNSNFDLRKSKAEEHLQTLLKK
jgi:hypothetical protein